MDIVRDYEQELFDAGRQAQERMIVRAIASGLITQEGGQALLQEIRGINE